MRKIECKKCGSTEEVAFYGDSPLCVDCAESSAYDEAFPPGDNFTPCDWAF